MGTISESKLGTLFLQHFTSLPVAASAETRSGLNPWRTWPWLTLFVVIPVLGAFGLEYAHQTRNTSVGMVAGLGVLAGLLFQVLAWVASRLAAIADAIGQRKATHYELGLVRRLDIARANIAYTSFVAIMSVITLGIASMFKTTPYWLNVLLNFLQLHLGLTLILVLLRINSLGQSDRISALTAHAREANRR